MKYIGAHVSAAGGVENAPLNSAKIGASAFAFFAKNQKQWFAAPLTESNIENFKANCRKHGFSREQILPHSGYLINPGSPEPDKLERARESFLQEIKRCEQLGLKYLNFHPGAHKKLVSEDDCLKITAETINIMHQKSKNLILVIENTAGQGSSIGHKFEQLKRIIDLVDEKQRVGVCIDTCHAFAAGYDLSSYKETEKVFQEFDEVIGFEWLCGMHLNDSIHELAAKKDRHANLGEGKIGLQAFQYIMHNKKFDEIPLILETRSSEKWADEVKLLKEMQGV